MRRLKTRNNQIRYIRISLFYKVLCALTETQISLTPFEKITLAWARLEPPTLASQDAKKNEKSAIFDVTTGLYHYLYIYEHGVVVRAFGMNWGDNRFVSRSAHHCWALSKFFLSLA